MSYDDDDDEYEEYECVNVGCMGERTFLDHPEEWYENRQWETPKNCYECREWIKAQLEIGPIVAVCQFCGFHWPIYANLRIRHHRITSNWDAYWQENESLQICYRCAEFPTRRHRLMRIAAERKSRDPAQRKTVRDILEEDDRVTSKEASDILTGSAGRAPLSYLVPAEALYYHGVKTWSDRTDRHGETQLTHIMKDEHKWGKEFGTNDPGTVLTLGAHIARSTEPHIREFVDPGDVGKVFKYDTQQRVLVIIVSDESSPTGNRLETVFPKSPKNVLAGKIRTGDWK